MASCLIFTARNLNAKQRARKRASHAADRCEATRLSRSLHYQKHESAYLNWPKQMLPRMKYVDRDQAVLDAAKGRKVLHLGCVGFTDLATNDRIRLARESLHWKLSKTADVIGIDYSRRVIEEYERLGVFRNIRYGNLERLHEVALEGTFAVIIAGDVIEHLSNPGLMLEGVKKFCTPDTTLIITTPHAFGLPNFIRWCLNRFREGDEHVMTFNADNIRNLLTRHGYAITNINSCFQSISRNQHSPIVFTGLKSLLGVFPRLGGTLIVEAKLLTSLAVPCSPRPVETKQILH